MKAWDDFLLSLEPTLGANAVAEWLKPIQVIRFDAANLTLRATPFQRAWFEEHVRFHKLYNNNQRPIRIHWEERAKQSAKNSFSGANILPTPLDKTLRLDSYLVSPANDLAYRMALEVASGQKAPFNPLFFWGKKGSGKTHLLTGIALSLQEQGRNVFYVNAETFTEHVVNAIRQGFMLEFRKTYRDVDVLIVEDIHLLARRTATQEEFFHTFNPLHTAGKQIILSADTAPNQLRDIEPRLVSRFEWGISLKIEELDRSLLERMLTEKARALDFPLSSLLTAFLLERFSSTPTALLSALHALALRSPQGADPAKAQSLLSDLLAKESQSLLTPDKIIKQIATYFGIRAEDFTGKSQMREFAQPRQLAMFLCRTQLHMPFQAIGRLFKRDHSTVMTSIRLVEKAIQEKRAPFADALQRMSIK